MSRRLWHNPRSSRLRVWMFNIHLYTGLALGLVLTLVGLTGSLIVYKPETERLFSSSIAAVKPLPQNDAVHRCFGSNLLLLRFPEVGHEEQKRHANA